jgi:hypothetical protein
MRSKKIGRRGCTAAVDRLRRLVCAGLGNRAESSLSRGRVLGVALALGYRLGVEEAERWNGIRSKRRGEAKRSEARELVV